MKKKEILYYLPFGVLLLVELFIHWKINLNIPGDDAVFLSYSQEEGYSLLSWLAERYMTWSSRTLIEAMMMIMVNLPPIIWRVTDAIVVLAGVVTLTKLLEKKGYREYYSFYISLAFLALPYSYMSLAGWVATSVNYMWPLAAGLIGIYPIRKYIDEKNIKLYEKIFFSICLIFAGNSEQIAFILFVSYGGYIIYLLIIREGAVILTCYRYILFQFGLSILCLVYILVCPGNTNRSQAEMITWLPEFASYSILKKIELGISETIKAVFVLESSGFLIMTFLLAVLIWQSRKEWIYRMLALIPAFVVLLFTEVRRLLGSSHSLFQLNRVDNIALAVVCGIVLLSFYLLFGKKVQFFLTSGIFLVALATKAVMGFSPTIYASGERTAWVMNFLLLGCVAVLLSKWDFSHKQSNILLSIAFLYLCAPGILLNYVICT